jgi:hypothetical protein
MSVRLAVEYRCPACSAPVGAPCHSLMGAQLILPHTAREELTKVRETDD